MLDIGQLQIIYVATVTECGQDILIETTSQGTKLQLELGWCGCMIRKRWSLNGVLNDD